jgi:Flp pilus assembly protein TadD
MRCGAPLQAYAHLLSAAACLFNRGLKAARAGDFRLARDLFASVVYWCPIDMEARNALAAACFAVRDFDAASLHWKVVLTRSPSDAIAMAGVEAVKSGRAPQRRAKRKRS